MKIAIRNKVARGGHFEDAGGCVSFLNKKIASSFDHVYSQGNSFSNPPDC